MAKKKLEATVPAEDTRKTYYTFTERVFHNGDKKILLLGGFKNDKKPENKIFERKTYKDYVQYLVFDSVEEARAHRDKLRAEII